MIIKVKNEIAKVGKFFELKERSCVRRLRERENRDERSFFSWQEKSADAIHVADAKLDMGFGVKAGAFECRAAFGEGASYGIERIGG